MKIHIALFCFSVLLFISCKQETAYHANIEREYIKIPLRDGVKLGAILYKPNSEGSFPAIVYRTPYNIEDYDSYAELPLKAIRRGYMVVLVDVRGRYSSEGEFEAYRNEKKDGYDVIEWVAKMPNCNGKIVTYGGSYPGIVQWLAMAENPPHLVAAAPEMTPISSHHFWYYGGAFSHPWLDWFTPYILPDKRKRSQDPSGSWDDIEGEAFWHAQDKHKWYSFKPMDSLPIFGDYAPEYFDWLNHPIQDDWWDFAEVESHFAEFKQPVFLLSGWYDAAYGPQGAAAGYDKINKLSSKNAAENSKLILGPWNHTSINVRKNKFGIMDFGPSSGFDYDKELLDWYDSIVFGKPDPDPIPSVSYFIMGANEWRSDIYWPPSNSSDTSLYLNLSLQSAERRGLLSGTIESGSNGSVAYRFDPKNPLWDSSYLKSAPFDQSVFDTRSDVLIFESGVLESDLDIAGEVVLELFVSSTAPDTDFSFSLCDVFPDGKVVNLAGLDAGYLRMRYRDGSKSEQLIQPGTIYPIKIGQYHTANRFKKGHKIRLMITSSKAPHYDVNPNTGREIAKETELRACDNTIYISQDSPSRVILPVLK